MSNNLELSSRAILFGESPAVTPDEIRARAAAWYSGEVVASRAVAVGQISADLLAEERLLRIVSESEYNRVSSDGLLGVLPAMSVLRAEFSTVVSADKRRGGIDKKGTDVLFAGNTATVPGLRYHSDQSIIFELGTGKAKECQALARWVVSRGAGSTRGAVGNVRRIATPPGAFEAVDTELIVQEFDLGTVVRILLGDIHASPEESGSRILLKNTVNYQMPDFDRLMV